VGGFNPESFGDIWLGNGETGLQYKLQERRLGIGFIPNALVYHHIPPQRMTVSYLCQRMANEGACDIYSRYHCGIPSVWKLFKDALSIVLRYGRLWLAAWQVKGKTDPDSLLQQLQASRLQSQVRYLGRLMSDRTFHSSLGVKTGLAQSCLKNSLTDVKNTQLGRSGSIGYTKSRNLKFRSAFWAEMVIGWVFRATGMTND